MTTGEAKLDVRVSGRVQMVGFRAFVRDLARQLGLAGWVRNSEDGSLLVEAEGQRPALDALLDALRQGPPAASVEEVDVAWGMASGVGGEFEVRN